MFFWSEWREAGERDGVSVPRGDRSVSDFLPESRRRVGEGLRCLQLQVQSEDKENKEPDFTGFEYSPKCFVLIN